MRHGENGEGNGSIHSYARRAYIDTRPAVGAWRDAIIARREEKTMPFKNGSLKKFKLLTER